MSSSLALRLVIMSFPSVRRSAPTVECALFILINHYFSCYWFRTELIYILMARSGGRLETRF